MKTAVSFDIYTVLFGNFFFQNEPEAFHIPGGVSVGRQFIIRGKVDYSAER